MRLSRVMNYQQSKSALIQISAYCRSHGIYAHHIDQWKLDFLGASGAPESVPSQLKVRQLSKQNQKLKRDLNRKDKALAETAALLVLQKKVHDIWKEEDDEDEDI